MTTNLSDFAVPHDVEKAWSEALQTDDDFCKRKSDWGTARDHWASAAQACRKAGPAFEDMTKMAESARNFYAAQQERAVSLPMDKRYRTPWRSRW